MENVQCLLESVQCVIESVQCLVGNVQCLLESVQCLLESVQCLLESVQYLLESVQCLVESVQCLVTSVLCLVRKCLVSTSKVSCQYYQSFKRHLLDMSSKQAIASLVLIHRNDKFKQDHKVASNSQKAQTMKLQHFEGLARPVKHPSPQVEGGKTWCNIKAHLRVIRVLLGASKGHVGCI